MKKMILPLILASSVSMTLFSTSAISATNDSAATNKVMVVERSGKPPFKRTFVNAKEVDVAQFETMNEALPCEKRVSVTMRGKPPFKRVTECVPVVNMAQFEQTDDARSTDFRGSPPFKRH